MTQDPILSVRGLQIRFRLRGRTLHAIRYIDLDLYRGEVLALVGESGSGKSVRTAASLAAASTTTPPPAAPRCTLRRSRPKKSGLPSAGGRSPW